MSRSVRISPKAARVLEHVGARFCAEAEKWAVDELRRAMAPPENWRTGSDGRHLSPVSTERRRAHMLKYHAKRRQETADIWDACRRRADGVCECGCGRPYSVIDGGGSVEFPAPQLDHMFGRGKGRLPQSEATCWILRADCHRSKTTSRPDAGTWFRRFVTHAERHGYALAAAHAQRRLEGIIHLREATR